MTGRRRGLRAAVVAGLFVTTGCLEVDPGFAASATDPTSLPDPSTSSTTEAATTTTTTTTTTTGTTTEATTAASTGNAATSDTSGSTGPPPPRVTDGLLVLYLFDDGSGDVVADVSQVAPPLDLTIADPANVTWGPGTLTVDTATIISAAAAPDKIVDACTASREVTMEAWIASSALDQAGPARVMTLSVDTAMRAFTLGQDLTDFSFRLNTTMNEDNGTPSLGVTGMSLTPTHVVYTRQIDGDISVYVNGLAIVQSSLTGDFTPWPPGLQWAIANEFGLARPFLGQFDLIAVYDRALTAPEVMQNFEADR